MSHWKNTEVHCDTLWIKESKKGRKYGADHKCACSRATLGTVWVAVNASVSWSVGSHVWDGVHDFSHEPHVMWDGVCVHECVQGHVYSFVSTSLIVWEFMCVAACVTGHQSVGHTGRIVCSVARLAFLHMWSRGRRQQIERKYFENKAMSVCEKKQSQTKVYLCSLSSQWLSVFTDWRQK